ncbi:DUF2721 domain-containing protein [Granulibacter bethesdensis]|uniref:Uncharacterized protein n=1 Tax=Granulibacter bethesdensis (strain ATCC BAA-1260 / CGDNIH1) TaxID=391165 RepID=Q0BSV5_GRABC|nr:DUF2721 domain-containing protein [Granulibacter bethesdensis]ABI62097.1 Hypothetical protein GbCGDNIH1_1199 [Granulibacter bethesdensis CGDNIH1]AHJ66429.1 Hypothetical protein GbCGDNIH4_1199 [Granulibacter bethesdensis CGDNIH4]APH51921.1 Hypothetical protein GbCGDNIH5_1199 [Granulibacter bethesdensis]APH59524.1 Hypothetical protein GbCGDNIH7_1199 [Granulibacter bethesdensis]APH64611.1 Hypothetical protein GbCGDNIH1I4_1199 [Granulibacter bethesdensis]
MPIPFLPSEAVDSTAHMVQIALTPIFLLNGVGTLLNVFNTRLARVSDHNQRLSEMRRDPSCTIDKAILDIHRHRLRWRLRALDAAIALTACAGAATCGTAFILFLGSLHDSAIASWLELSFGAALICVILALMSFFADTMLAWHGLRREGPLPDTASK